MLVVGLFAVRLLGVEAFGAFSLAFATGIGLLQFVPDAVSVYFARLRWIGEGAGSTPSTSARVAGIATVSALLALIALTVGVALLIPSLYLFEPYASDASLRQATVILAVASPLFGVGQVLTAQLTVNGHERAGMSQALVLGVAQLTLPVLGAYAGGMVGLAWGLLAAIVVFATYAWLNGRRLLSLGKLPRRGEFLSSLRSTASDANGLARLTLSLLLGAPVHWFVLRMLGSQENGLYEVGNFAYAYYFYTFMILVPSSMQSYLVGRLTRARGGALGEGGRSGTARIVGYVALLATAAAGLFAAAHTLLSPTVLGTGSFDLLLPGYLCIASGAIGIGAIIASQTIISDGHFSLQLKGTVVSACVYAGSAGIAIYGLGMGAAAVAAALGLGQAMQLIFLAVARQQKLRSSVVG